MDQQLFTFFFSLAYRAPAIDFLIRFFANFLPYLMGVFFVGYALSVEDWRRKLFMLGEGLLAIILARGLITEIIRFFYVHPRPFEALGIVPLIPESGNSFPSGHMTFFFALAAILWYASRKWGTIFGLLAFAVGIARIVAGVHWPLDIVGGILIGIVSGMFIHHLLALSWKELKEVNTLS